MTVPQPKFSDAELAAYLDEALAADLTAEIERAAREDQSLAARIAEVLARREAGIHSLGEIWRRNRLTCPSRSEWGSYLLGALEAEQAEYLRFHVEVAGCRWCQANLADLQAERDAQPAAATQRRRKYFQSSAGRLPARAK